MLLIELQLPALEHAPFRFKERPGNSVNKSKNFPAKAVRPRLSSSNYARFQAH